MDRNALQALLLAGLCVVVVVFAAATLTDTTTPGGGLGFGGDGSSGFSGSGGDGLAGEDGDEGGRGLPINNSTGGGAGGGGVLCVEWLKGSGVAGALVMGLILLGGAVAYVRNYIVGLGAMLVVGWPGFILYILLTACGASGASLTGSLSPDGDGQAGASGSGVPGTGDAVADPSISTILLVVAGVLVVGVLVAFALGAGEDDEEEDEDDGESKRFAMPDLGGVGEAAGDAADRIEATEAVDNEVYRAWREMTDQLNVPDPETSSPAEFRDAAVAAGMDPDDVDRLTDLFEEVRYGDADATEAREREAVDVLRRIEAAYGDGGERA